MCVNGGVCMGSQGCRCPPNYDARQLCAQCDACHSGPDTGCVTLTNKCNYHGTCKLQVATGAPLCVCEEGWGGMGCTEQLPFTITPAQATNAAAVAVPLVLVAVAAAAGVFVWKRRNPGESAAGRVAQIFSSALASVRSGRLPQSFASSTASSAAEDGDAGVGLQQAAPAAGPIFATPGKERTSLLGRR